MTTSAAERVVVDLSGVTMITTPGITMLVAAERNVRRRKGKLVLCGLTGRVEQVLVERCRLDAVFTVKTTVDDAVASAGA
jgi:anti-anti-sigma factor